MKIAMLLSGGVDSSVALRLLKEEGGHELRGQVGRSEIDPIVLLHAAALELGSVRALVPDDLFYVGVVHGGAIRSVAR